MLAWGDIYARHQTRSVFFFGSLSLLLCAALVGAISWLVQPARLVVVAAMPVLCGVLLRLSARYIGPPVWNPVVGGEEASTSDTPSSGRAVRYSFPWKPVAIMVIAGLEASTVTVAVFAQGTYPHVLAQGVLGALVLAAVLIPRIRISPVALIPTAMLCLAASMAVVALAGAGGGFLAAFLAMLSSVACYFFTLSLLAETSRRRQISPVWLFGIALAARELAGHAGAYSRFLFPDVDVIRDDRLQLAFFAVAGLLGIIAMGALWMSERSFRADWTVETIDAQTGEHAISAHEAFLLRCESLGSKAGLSAREIEVMAMLASRNTYQDIAEELVLSLNTVKSHAHHIYGKLGIHTRDELIDRIESV